MTWKVLVSGDVQISCAAVGTDNETERRRAAALAAARSGGRCRCRRSAVARWGFVMVSDGGVVKSDGRSGSPVS